jgi:hypothetical protein
MSSPKVQQIDAAIAEYEKQDGKQVHFGFHPEMKRLLNAMNKSDTSSLLTQQYYLELYLQEDEFIPKHSANLLLQPLQHLRAQYVLKDLKTSQLTDLRNQILQKQHEIDSADEINTTNARLKQQCIELIQRLEKNEEAEGKKQLQSMLTMGKMAPLSKIHLYATNLYRFYHWVCTVKQYPFQEGDDLSINTSSILCAEKLSQPAMFQLIYEFFHYYVLNEVENHKHLDMEKVKKVSAWFDQLGTMEFAAPTVKLLYYILNYIQFDCHGKIENSLLFKLLLGMANQTEDQLLLQLKQTRVVAEHPFKSIQSIKELTRSSLDKPLLWMNLFERPRFQTNSTGQLEKLPRTE